MLLHIPLNIEISDRQSQTDGDRLVRELHLMMGLGAVIGVIASVSGMYVSYYQNVPSGSAIVLIISGFFLLALLFSPSQGILTKRALTQRAKTLLSKIKASK